MANVRNRHIKEFCFLNVKLLHNQEPENYVKLFEDLLREDYVVPLPQKRNIELIDFRKGNYPDVYVGKLIMYTDKRPLTVYDKKKKQIVQAKHTEDENTQYSDPVEGIFFLIPNRHRIAVALSSGVSIDKVETFVKIAGCRLLGVDQIHTSLEISKNFIKEIEDAQQVSRIEISWTYTNKDFIDGFAHSLDDASKKGNAATITMSIQSAKDESLNCDKDTLPGAVLRIGQSNASGAVNAIISNPEYGKNGNIKKLNKKRVQTSAYPLRQRFSFLDAELCKVLFDFVMSYFK